MRNRPHQERVLPLLIAIVAATFLGSCASPCTTNPPKESAVSDLTGCVFCGLTRAGVVSKRKSEKWPRKELAQFEDPISLPVLHQVNFENGSTENQTVTITILKPREDWNGRILWYFHGVCAKGYFTDDLSGKETLAIYNGFEKGKPIVITLGMGDFRVIDQDSMGQFLNTMELAFRTAIPEAQTRKSTRHWALGISMGGLNGLQTFMFGDRAFEFERAVFVAPYIPRCDPFAITGCQECLKDKGARGEGEKSFYHNLSRKGIRAVFSEREWNERNPVNFAERGGFRGREHAVKLVWGTQDMFGFDVTAKELAEKAGFKEPIFGDWGHEMPNNETDVLAMATFLESAIDPK